VTSRPRVLLVDDEEHNLTTFQRTFRRDFDVAIASSGADGLTRLLENAFDVVLSDYAMPHMNGLELLRRVRDAHPNVARLLVTAYPDNADVVAAHTGGLVLAIIEKPWTREKVLEWVGRICHV
jgi:CheY-like chemotaxis protein